MIFQFSHTILTTVSALQNGIILARDSKNSGYITEYFSTLLGSIFLTFLVCHGEGNSTMCG